MRHCVLQCVRTIYNVTQVCAAFSELLLGCYSGHLHNQSSTDSFQSTTVMVDKLFQENLAKISDIFLLMSKSGYSANHLKINTFSLTA